MFYLLEYVRIDRFGKFQVKDLRGTIEILEYYLFVHMLLARINAYGWTGTSTARACQ